MNTICTTPVPVPVFLQNDKMSKNVFVLRSHRGSWVILSEVKVSEASLPSDSFCHRVTKVNGREVGGNQGSTLEAAGPALHGAEQNVSCGGSASGGHVSTLPLNHHVTWITT